MALQAPDPVVEMPLLRAAPRSVRLPAMDLGIPAVVLVLIVVGCFLGPAVLHLPGPSVGDLNAVNRPPLSPGHLLGTDDLGNDLLSRAFFGGRLSIEVGLGSVALGLIIGGSLGVVAAYRGGMVDSVIMRILDMFLAFPSLVLALAVSAYLGPNERDVIFAITFFTMPAYARLARAEGLRVRQRNFVVSAQLVGGKASYVITRHVVPNVAPSLLTFGLLTVAVAMLIEAALSFLGLGVPPPAPSWGGMIASGQQYLGTNPWMALVPGGFLFVTVLCLNLLGEKLRRRLQQA